MSILLAAVQWSNEWHMEVSFRLHCEMVFTKSLSQTVSVNIQTHFYANMITDIKAGLRSEPHTSGCHPWLKNNSNNCWNYCFCKMCNSYNEQVTGSKSALSDTSLKTRYKRVKVNEIGYKVVNSRGKNKSLLFSQIMQEKPCKYTSLDLKM